MGVLYMGRAAEWVFPNPPLGLTFLRIRRDGAGELSRGTLALGACGGGGAFTCGTDRGFPFLSKRLWLVLAEPPTGG